MEILLNCEEIIIHAAATLVKFCTHYSTSEIGRFFTLTLLYYALYVILSRATEMLCLGDVFSVAATVTDNRTKDGRVGK
jgi:uncharacterized membrane protein YcfT